jgi:hypothetical protein
MQASNQVKIFQPARQNLVWVAPVVQAIAVWENTLAANNNTSDGPLCPGRTGPTTNCSAGS